MEVLGGLIVRILGFHCCGLSSVPGQEIKILQAMWYGPQKKKNQGLVTRKSVIQIHNLYILILKIHLHVFMMYKFITFT